MKNYYVFLLTLFILLTNCEQEMSLSEETDPSVHATEISSDAPFTIEVIPFSETDNLFGNLNLGSHLYHSDRDVGLKRNSGASGIEIYPGMV
ncbi:hypothetical protein M8845_16500 [Gelidibacter japonicus]|uniref:hypothetical protein n=1 Tax=Gelidibacter japonicus TaxID=1962232 RepID=UPI0020209082|nr:hypothetical protein [Gelidibacter japonicus]MCL8009033.1 hypothetical protein [Gelidibacter japonicus]